MPRIPLLGGAYQSRSIIAGAQRCINLYPEVNEDAQAPAPVTHFPTPGLTQQGVPPAAGIGRCVFRASNGELFEVVGDSVYFVDENFNYLLLGIVPILTTPVVMKDNGLVIVLVDSTTTGYAIKLSTHAFATINDPNFLGGTYVDYMDSFFILNVPGVNEWQISLAFVTFENLTAGVITPPNLYAAFDPLDVAAKTGSPDAVTGVICMHRNVWTVGALTTEIWYNSGAADFTFATAPGVYIEHGNVAIYSLATQDLSVFWLSQDRQGKCTVMRGTADYNVKELSSKGVEAIIGSFDVVSDAIGGCYQQFGHAYYVLTFPTANRTFQVELKTGQWTELAFSGANGLERHRANGWAFAYGMNLICDRQTGNLYQLDPTNFTDYGNPITRLRTIPHLLNDGKRLTVSRLMADTQGGTLGNTFSPPYSTSIQTIIQDLGLTGNLKLLLEAGNLPSWGGAGTKWNDESGGGYDFFRGADGTVQASDPSFNGVAGNVSLSEYWGFDGAQYFTYDSANEAWMNNIHKAGAKFTAVCLAYIASLTATRQCLIGDSGLTLFGHIGFHLRLDNTGLTYGTGNNTGAANFLVTYNPAALTVGAWHLFSISVDDVAGTYVIGVDDSFSAGGGHYLAPSALAADQVLQIGAAGAANIPFSNGARMGFAAIWEGTSLTQAELTSLYEAILANNQLPSPAFASPKIFLRISYNRGGSFSDALEAEFGASGNYEEFPFWPNIGTARDFVYELSWSAPINTALNGVFWEGQPAKT